MNIKEVAYTAYNKAFEPRRTTWFITGRESRVKVDDGVQLVIKNDSRKPLLYMQQARETALLAINRVQKLIPLKDCSISLFLMGFNKNDNHLDPSAGAHLRDSSEIFTHIDSASSVFGPAHITRVQEVIVHESHHLVRKRGPGIGKTLFEMLISEGLALCFAEDLTGYLPIALAPHLKHLTRKDLGNYWKRIRQMCLDNSEEHYQNWFGPFVPREGNFPSHIGYPLGHYLVRRFLDCNSEETAASLVTAPVEVFCV